MDGLAIRNPGEVEFHQAVREVAEALLPYIDRHPVYREFRILERMTEPDRTVSFRVSWQDDAGEIRVNRGYRVQMNNAMLLRMHRLIDFVDPAAIPEEVSRAPTRGGCASRTR